MSSAAVRRRLSRRASSRLSVRPRQRRTRARNPFRPPRRARPPQEHDMSPSSQSVRSLAEKRVRRQKIFIAVGSIALLAILGFELPKIMGGKNGQSAAPGVSTAAPGAVAPVIAPGQLPGTDRVIVQRDSNQLISFGLFKSKDPFVQQLTTSATATTPTSI